MAEFLTIDDYDKKCRDANPSQEVLNAMLCLKTEITRLIADFNVNGFNVYDDGSVWVWLTLNYDAHDKRDYHEMECGVYMKYHKGKTKFRLGSLCYAEDGGDCVESLNIELMALHKDVTGVMKNYDMILEFLKGAQQLGNVMSCEISDFRALYSNLITEMTLEKV